MLDCILAGIFLLLVIGLFVALIPPGNTIEPRNDDE